MSIGPDIGSRFIGIHFSEKNWPKGCGNIAVVIPFYGSLFQDSYRDGLYSEAGEG
jgi:hypothetical protein